MQKTIWAIIVIVVAILAVILLTGNEVQAPVDGSDSATTTEETGDASEEGAQTDAGTPPPATISYTNSGFSPSSLTISEGETVTFINNSSSDFWPASAVHPTHKRYDGTILSEHCADPGSTAFDACEAVASGQSWSFTFEKTGEWTYHNHLNASRFGRIIVE